MRELKFRAWDKRGKKWFVNLPVCIQVDETGRLTCFADGILMQYIGLQDNSNPPKEIYKDDIIEFENGDRIVIKQEDWLEFYCDPIGEPKCSDQWRDLYRISQGKVIGDIYRNPQLLNKE